MQQNKQSAELDSIRDPESGQASVLLLLMLSTFLLGVMAFAVDLTGLWFHRQAVQSAADAACLAGASDMLAIQAGLPAPSGFSLGTNSDCATSPSAPLCQYAGFNGYNGGGIKDVNGSNAVTWNFPSLVSGVTTPQGSYPYLRVAITENVKTYFEGFLNGSSYQPVSASSTCGVIPIRSAVPLIILDRTASGSLSIGGNAQVSIFGGPSRSIQVNSGSNTAVSAGTINTSMAGPNGTGGDIAIAGAETSAPGTISLGTGRWLPSSLPVPDPFSRVSAPVVNSNGVITAGVPYHHDGCPDTSGCDEYSPGYYGSGISIKNTTAIFQPGVYVLDGGFTLGSLSNVRNAYVGSASAQLTTAGVMFYLHTGAVSVGSNAAKGGLDSVPVSLLSCDGTVPNGIPTTPLTTSFLVAQCTDDGTYAGSGGTGTLSSLGSRGLLFFEDHSNAAAPAYAGSGGGSLLFAGTEYFKSNATPGLMSFSGTPSGTTYVVGKLVTDQLAVIGNSNITMVLSTKKMITTLKVALLQ